MTIMVAGAAALALTGSVPSAAAQSTDGSLTVSAGEAGVFYGAQVVEIVVQNDEISEQTEVEGIPIVTIGDRRVLMTQTTDGAWYAYVGHTSIETDHHNVAAGLNYGQFCTVEEFGAGELLSDTGADRIAVSSAACNGGNDISDNDYIVSEPKTVTPALVNTVTANTLVDIGQVRLQEASQWPFIQLYNFGSGESAEVVYDKAGTDDEIALAYDTFEDQSASLDRSEYPLSASVYLSITDHQINLDPTTSDEWRWVFESATADTGVLHYGDSGTPAGLGYLEEGSITIPALLRDNPTSVTITESADNSGLFEAWDNNDDAELTVPNNQQQAPRNTDILIEYGDPYAVIVGFDDANLTFDASVLDGAWTSGVELPVTLTDADINTDSMDTNDFVAIESPRIPFIKVGNPITLIDDPDNADRLMFAVGEDVTPAGFAGRFAEFAASSATAGENSTSFVYVNYDVSNTGGTGIAISDDGTNIFTHTDANNPGVGYARVELTSTPANAALEITGATGSGLVYIDVFRFGLSDRTSNADRHNDAIYRMELEESGDNTSTYEGTIEYVMINQFNVFAESTYNRVDATDDNIIMIVHEDLTGTDAISVGYNDLGATGGDRFESAQEDAPTYSGTVEFDSDTYKVGDTVTVTVTDSDLNTAVDRRESYRIATSGTYPNTIAAVNGPEFLLEVTLDDNRWQRIQGCNADDFASTTMTLLETTASSGVFTGTFDIPSTYCAITGEEKSATGVDLGVNYVDFRDSSGNVIEVDDSVGIRANTGSVSLDRTVYPVPFADVLYPVHSTPANNGEVDHLAGKGNLTVYVTINDPDFDVSANGIDEISLSDAPLTVEINRGSESRPIHTAGGLDSAIKETESDTGVFEHDFTISYNMGIEVDPVNAPGVGARECPEDTLTERPITCILQGDILTVTYEDPTDAAGEPNTVTDSATFDLRTGALQTDKSVYIIGSDMIITLIDQDLDLDSGSVETYDLNLIEWDDSDSSAGLGERDEDFSPTPNALRETGENTGIFQTVIEIPATVRNDELERGEEINLEYTDYGPSGAENVIGTDGEDIGTSVFTSNFGATIELDQKVYSWTDKVFITIVAPDHNFDPDNVDEIGETGNDPIRIATRSDEVEDYRLVETGADTGIFSGEVILVGFAYDADGDSRTGDNGNDGPFGETSPRGAGPTNGMLETSDDDGITVSFEFSPDETVVGSALVRWNIAETQWLESSYPATGTGTVRIVDPDMNWNPESIDNFNVDVWSDSDVGGIDLTVTETNQATGIFEGTVFFTVNDISDGHRLRVAEGDTVTASYEDHTLPAPDDGDSATIAGTTLIGTVVPPLERVIVGGERVVDSFGNALASVSVDQQVQVTADLMSNQDRQQEFAYLLQIQDGNGVTVSLAWIEGALAPGQSFSPAQSWIPTAPGTYDATVFVWESVGNPTALAPQTQLSITVS